MNFLRDAASNIWSSKLRSLLTLIGVMIGTGAVVAMMACGQLATEATLDQFRAIGMDVLDISFFSSSDKKNSPHTHRLTLKDIAQLNNNAAITAIAPYTQQYTANHFHGHVIQGALLGVTADFLSLTKAHLLEGRFISPLDHQPFFCIIGHDIAKQIKTFYLDHLLGQRIAFGQNGCVIIGVLKEWPQNLLLSAPINQAVLLPLQTMMQTDSTIKINNIFLQVAPHTDIALIKSTLTKQLQYRLPDQHILIRSPQELIARVQAQSDILATLLGLIGSITLLVGGVGIMNVMLVCVLERQREIGIRLALGATTKDIGALFLSEAVLLAWIGGIPGIAIGLLISRLSAFFWQWPFHFFLFPPLAGFTVAILTGILAGLYPAIRAAHLDPVTALRAD